LILNGPLLIFSPKKAWQKHVSGSSKSAAWLLPVSLTAAIFPAVAVVVGHLASSMLGFETSEIAIRRAVVGLVATVGGAMVMAPALALGIKLTSSNAKLEMPVSTSVVTSMGLVWPAWASGIVLCVPPVLGFGPAIGEIVWFFTASICVFYVLKKAATKDVGVRRRWASSFVVQTTVAFVILFAIISVGPAVAVRALMGVSGKVEPPKPDPIAWPVPHQPDW